MRDFEKEKLVENITFTSQHVSKANHLVEQYHRIHRVPFHSLSALLVAILLFLLLWSSGLVHVVHTVADKIATTLISIEYVPPTQDGSAANEVAVAEELVSEEEPFIDLSFITDVFTSTPKYSSSAVFMYAVVVAVFDTLIIFGLVVAITYGIFYGYHVYRVSRQRDKISKIVKELGEVLATLNSSVIDEEYWHVPYLKRMESYFKQNRVDDLRSCYELIDLEIRHKQLVQALTNNGWVDARALSESTVHPKSMVLNRTTTNTQEKATNLSN